MPVSFSQPSRVAVLAAALIAASLSALPAQVFAQAAPLAAPAVASSQPSAAKAAHVVWWSQFQPQQINADIARFSKAGYKLRNVNMVQCPQPSDATKSFTCVMVVMDLEQK